MARSAEPGEIAQPGQSPTQATEAPILGERGDRCPKGQRRGQPERNCERSSVAKGPAHSKSFEQCERIWTSDLLFAPELRDEAVGPRRKLRTMVNNDATNVSDEGLEIHPSTIGPPKCLCACSKGPRPPPNYGKKVPIHDNSVDVGSGIGPRSISLIQHDLRPTSSLDHINPQLPV